MKTKTVVIIGTIVLAVFLLAIIGLIINEIIRSTVVHSVRDYQECANASGVILETYPEQCVINGKTYTRELTQEEKDRLNPPSYPADSSQAQTFYGSSTNAACASNSDCVPMGCNSEICGGKSEGGLASICIFPDQPLPPDLGYSCSCVLQQCQWNK